MSSGLGGGRAMGEQAPERQDPAGDVVAKRTWVDLEQRLFWRVDVTDWLEEGDDTPERLQELARAKLDYHECQVGAETECTGWGWA